MHHVNWVVPHQLWHLASMEELPLACSGTEAMSVFHTAIQGHIINKGTNTMNILLEGPLRDGI